MPKARTTQRQVSSTNLLFAHAVSTAWKAQPLQQGNVFVDCQNRNAEHCSFVAETIITYLRYTKRVRGT
jgi:hypothetical protein